MTHYSIFTPPTLHTGALWRGKTVGLLGGSFNPAHNGHIHISKQALNRLPIDALWWSFTPGNPFKRHMHVPSVEERMEAAAPLIHDPRIIFTDIERQLGINRTYELAKALKIYFPQTRFIWVGGMDLPEEFHKWEHWRSVIADMPLAFFKRPPYKGTLKRIPLRFMRSVKHIYSLPKSPKSYKSQHIYWSMDGSTLNLSSTEMRQRDSKKHA